MQQGVYQPVAPQIGGVQTERVAAYLGVGARRFLPKFSGLELSGGSASWNAAVFLLGIFLGLPGMASWFLSKKIYKTGWLLFAGGLVLQLAMMILTGVLLKDMFNFIIPNIAFFGIRDRNLSGIMSFYKSEVLQWFTISIVVWLLQTTAVIFVSLFANRIYRDTVLKQLRRLPADMPLQMISNMGGNGEGAFVGSIFGYIGFNIICVIVVLGIIMKFL